MDLTKPVNPTPPAAIQAPACCKCGGQMEEGFVLDTYYDGARISSWVAGKPEFGFFGSVKVADKQQTEVLTFACIGCGYLESYINRTQQGPPPA